MKKIVSICLIILFTSCMTGCGSGTDDLIWSNGESVYVSILEEYKDEILEDVDKYFEDYDYKRLYISEIDANDYVRLVLVFVLNEGQDPLEFKTQIEKDEKIYSALPKKYIPYETINTQYVEIEKNVISVGETIEFDIKGDFDVYTQPFYFNSFRVKPKDTSKEYKVSDFPGIGLVEIEKDKYIYSEWLTFVLETDDYFNLVKAMDKIARTCKFEGISCENFAVGEFFPTSRIYVANPEIVELIWLDGGKKYLKGLKPGKTMVLSPGIKFEITVE